MPIWKKEPNWKYFSSIPPKKTLTRTLSSLLPKRTVWQPRNTVHTCVSTSCLLRGVVFFGTECTDLQSYEIAHYATSTKTKNLFTFVSSRYTADTLQNLHCFHAWLWFWGAHPRRSYKLSTAFFPHQWSKRNKTYSAWKPPHQAEIPHASLCIYLLVNHLVSTKAFLVSGIRFADLHFSWGLRWWKASCRAESTQLEWGDTVELSPGGCLFTCRAHHTPSSLCGLTMTQPPWDQEGWAVTAPHSWKTCKRKCSVQKPGSQVKLCRVKACAALFIERHSAMPTGIPSSATSPSSAEGDPCTTLSLLWQLQNFLPLEGSKQLWTFPIS